MKLLILFAIISTIYSCSGNTNQKDNNSFKGKPIILLTTDDKDILGNWSMCSESGGGQQIQYNVCPTIIFNLDGTGSKVTAQGLPENFNWTLKNRLLKVHYSRPNSGNTFSDTNYVALFNKHVNPIELEISQDSLKYTFYLAKKLD